MMTDSNPPQETTTALREAIVDIIKDQSAPLTYDSMFPEAQEKVRKLEALIQTVQKETDRQSRIDELEHVSDTGEGVWPNFDPEINPITREERLAALNQKVGSDV